MYGNGIEDRPHPACLRFGLDVVAVDGQIVPRGDSHASGDGPAVGRPFVDSASPATISKMGSSRVYPSLSVSKPDCDPATVFLDSHQLGAKRHSLCASEGKRRCEPKCSPVECLSRSAARGRTGLAYEPGFVRTTLPPHACEIRREPVTVALLEARRSPAELRQRSR